MYGCMPVSGAGVISTESGYELSGILTGMGYIFGAGSRCCMSVSR